VRQLDIKVLNITDARCNHEVYTVIILADAGWFLGPVSTDAENFTHRELILGPFKP